MREQVLDSMDLERERGITIKAQAVRVQWKGHELNLIDTPGHVDFTYEVSRSLAACEGALLVVDAAQGIEAQTLANAYLALENDLEIVPVVNKIDLPQADPEGAALEVARPARRRSPSTCWRSRPRRAGVEAVLEAVIERIPPPAGDPERAAAGADLRLLLRPVPRRGRLRARGGRHLLAAPGAEGDGARHRVRARGVGIFSPSMTPVETLTAGEVGYIVAGSRTSPGCASATRSPTVAKPAAEPLPGYREVKPMVFAGLYPTDSDAYPELRDALEKLKLNDAALLYEPETSQALGFGFRCGFLGLLHMEIVQERLEREFDLDLLATAPNVAYRVRDDRAAPSSRCTTRPRCRTTWTRSRSPTSRRPCSCPRSSSAR